MSAGAWSDAENVAVCTLYFEMLSNVLGGVAMNKRAMIRALTGEGACTHGDAKAVTCGACGATWCEGCDPAPSALCHICHGRGSLLYPLQSRSRQSVEAKLMNCTAAHIAILGDSVDAGAPTMSDHGYRPLSRYQSALRDAMALALNTFEDVQVAADRAAM